MNKKLAVTLLTGAAILGGAAAGIAGSAAAQTSTTTATSPTTQSATSNTSAPAGRPQGHAPLGGDGNVTAISGTTITMQEEADEGGASYTVETSGATFTKDGAAATIADIKVGDKIFVQGATNGTTVTATQVSVGHPGGMHGDRQAPGTSAPTGTQVQ